MLNKQKLMALSHLVFHCGFLSDRDTVLIICNPKTEAIARGLEKIALSLSSNVDVDVISDLAIHGSEPPNETEKKMLKSTLIICLTKMSLAHTKARFRSTVNGSRFLSLPDFSDEILVSPALMTDFHKEFDIVDAFTKKLSDGRRVTITSDLGTKLTADIVGRSGNCCPGFVKEPGDLGSPPDIEANISPIEEKSSGQIVVDGSIACPEIGLLGQPVILTIKDGLIKKWFSENKDTIAALDKMFNSISDRRTRYLAEIGIGLNPNAQLTGSMLTDEGALGTMHFGFGSNSTVGGVNNVPFHLDFVIRDATLEIDGECLINQGSIELAPS